MDSEFEEIDSDEVMGWKPPWLGHGDKLVGVVDMGR